MKTIITKEFLLITQKVVDNPYLELYVKLINDNLNTPKIKFKTQGHHVKPVHFYYEKDSDWNKRKEFQTKADQDNTNFKVNLLYKDHVLAHYYLSLCTIDKIKYANENSIFHVLGNSNFIADPNYGQIIKDIKVLDHFQELYEDMAKTRSERYTGRHCKPNTELHKQQISTKNKGVVYVRRFINNIWEVKKTHTQEEFDEYIKNGWEKGNRPREACNGNISEKITAAKKNKICIHKNCINKYIDAQDTNKYLADGWELGGHKLHMRARVTITKLGYIKKIFTEEIDKYLERGWNVKDENR